MLDERGLGGLDVVVGHGPRSALALRLLVPELLGLTADLRAGAGLALADASSGGAGCFGSIIGWSMGAFRSNEGVSARMLSIAFFISATSLSRIASSNWRWKPEAAWRSLPA